MAPAMPWRPCRLRRRVTVPEAMTETSRRSEWIWLRARVGLCPNRQEPHFRQAAGSGGRFIRLSDHGTTPANACHELGEMLSTMLMSNCRGAPDSLHKQARAARNRTTRAWNQFLAAFRARLGPYSSRRHNSRLLQWQTQFLELVYHELELLLGGQRRVGAPLLL